MVEETEEISDEQAILKIAQVMKDNAPTPDEKVNVHTFLREVVVTPDTTRVGNLRVDKDVDELGIPAYTLRGSKELSLISEKIMDNDYFKEYFEQHSQDTTATSLSREGFLLKQATTSTKNISDITKRRKYNKGWFSKNKVVEESGGQTIESQ
jgi:hypothetical protein